TLSQDEIRVLRECNTESFYYRCVPLSTLFSGLAYIGMKNGYLQKSVNYGYIPKMIAAAFLGFFGGKISYQRACEEKIMRLPNSNLAEAFRKRRGQVSFQESYVPISIF
ncbi:UNVERIFIED_CONTAM: hypothetical protein GTU68_011635, partial [Idotea baltica]|nr:hypothetical protein [Idotea baltica]